MADDLSHRTCFPKLSRRKISHSRCVSNGVVTRRPREMLVSKCKYTMSLYCGTPKTHRLDAFAMRRVVVVVRRKDSVDLCRDEDGRRSLLFSEHVLAFSEHRRLHEYFAVRRSTAPPARLFPSQCRCQGASWISLRDFCVAKTLFRFVAKNTFVRQQRMFHPDL